MSRPTAFHCRTPDLYWHFVIWLTSLKEIQTQLELPLQSNSRHHPTPLFWYLGFHGIAILNFINTPKASTHYGEYSYDVSWSLMKEINIFFKSPFFLFPWQLRQSLSYRFRFFWLISFHKMWMWQQTLLQNLFTSIMWPSEATITLNSLWINITY
jgi:hypothetical protein